MVVLEVVEREREREFIPSSSATTGLMLTLSFLHALCRFEGQVTTMHLQSHQR